jgi:hypothetical protein
MPKMSRDKVIQLTKEAARDAQALSNLLDRIQWAEVDDWDSAEDEEFQQCLNTLETVVIECAESDLLSLEVKKP